MAIRILIADDHRILRAGLKSLLTSDPNMEVVGEATTGTEALQAAQTLRPNIILMDIGMPGNEGLEATREVISSVPDSRVLMLTMHEDSAMVQECLRAGASGYIIKRAAESELIDAIYAVNRG
ncbi:response regulator transcription factor, partial [bacterium]